MEGPRGSPGVEWAARTVAGENLDTMGSDSMQPLALGDRGPAVADVRAALRTLGLLPDGDGVADGELAAESGEFDAATELAVRTFQQRRGLSVDGLVGEETYRALS